MNVNVYPSNLQGAVFAPRSKSVMQRVLAAALLTKGTTKVYLPCESADCLHVGQLIKDLGAQIEDHSDHLLIHGGLAPQANELHVGESGLGIRLFTSVAALCDQEMTLTGEGSLLSRPVAFFDEVMPQLGARCSSNNGMVPLTVQGPLKGGNIEIDGSMSSQFLTGLLMALPLAVNNSVVKVNNLKSIPYIELTIEVLKEFGIEIEHDDFKEFRIKGNQSYTPCEIYVDGDWSGAAFLMVAGAVASREGILIEGLDNEFTQADESIKGALLFAGAKLSYQEEGIKVLGQRLKGFQFDATHCPDLFPPLAALAAFCKGSSKITGVSRLEHKESNRGVAIQKEFAKAGIKVDLDGDVMTVHSGPIQEATLSSCHDHRMAMAASILGLGGAKIEIEDAEAIGKSYPLFFDDIEDLGGKLD